MEDKNKKWYQSPTQVVIAIVILFLIIVAGFVIHDLFGKNPNPDSLTRPDTFHAECGVLNPCD